MNRKMSYRRLKALAKISRLWFWLKEEKIKRRKLPIFCMPEVQMIQAQAFRYLLNMEHFRAFYFITWDTLRLKAFCQDIVMFSSDWNALIRHSVRVWGGGKDVPFFPPLWVMADSDMSSEVVIVKYDWCVSVCDYLHLYAKTCILL